jgi:histidyl-tRNA synthetase
MSIKAVRGVKDILPPEAEEWYYIEEKARDIFRKFGYREIRLPIFEETSLFVRSIGETTDIVEKEMYTFKDRKGRSLTLRPEATASVVRAYLEHKSYLKEPLSKLYYMGPMFRSERPQAGRYRQFHQIGTEIMGSSNPALDGETIFLAVSLLEELGLKDLEVQVNSLGCADCRGIYKKELEKYFKGMREKLCSDCRERLLRNPLRILDCKEEKCREYAQKAPSREKYLCGDCSEHFRKVRGYLGQLKVAYLLNPHLVRGLDYYTRTAFEIVDRHLGAQNALCGGGRYDNLIEELGGPSLPAVGFSLGLERVALSLKEQKVEVPDLSGLDVYLANLGEGAFEKSFELAQALRKKGLITRLNYGEKSLKAQLKAADRLKAKYTVILGEDELKKGVALIRNMEKSTQEEVELKSLAKRLEEDRGR